MTKLQWPAVLLIACLLAACGKPSQTDTNQPEGSTGLPSDPSPITIQANSRLSDCGNESDVQDFEDAQRGYVMQLSMEQVPGMYHDPENAGPGGGTLLPAWDITGFANQMVERSVGEILPAREFPTAPDSVNPCLWRQAVLNAITGVFEVADGIYQVRGYDVTNMTLVAGDDGWIVIDPLMSAETAQAAWDDFKRYYYYQRVIDEGKSPEVLDTISALVYTHPHGDHYRGSIAFDVELAPDVEIWAPEGFNEHAITENVTVGNAMTRRAVYMYGSSLNAGDRTRVDAGQGKSISTGAAGLLEAVRFVDSDGTGTIDGQNVHFFFVPGTEAPTEMMIYFEKQNAFCAAENINHSMHNVLTPRGAQVRNPLDWSAGLQKVLDTYGDFDVLFTPHHWPVWKEVLNPIGNEPPNRTIKIIEDQRDLYKYIHDQAVRLTNHGFTIQEVGEMLELPEGLAAEWYNHGFYGTLSFNARAVYQSYIGWYDGNPASLNQLPPKDASVKYVDYMGGFDTMMENIEGDISLGNYRWAAMALNHIVFAGSADHTVINEVQLSQAKERLAYVYDQLGYQTQSAPWRNFYLTGAKELRNGFTPRFVSPISESIAEAMALENILDYLSIRLNGPKAAAWDYTFNLLISGEGEGTNDMDAVLYVKNGVMRYVLDKTAANPTATIKTTRGDLEAYITSNGELDRDVTQGNSEAVDQFLNALDTFLWFNIVEPNDPSLALGNPDLE